MRPLLLLPALVAALPAMATDEGDEVRRMFTHGYRSYLDHAFPRDELAPLSCTGFDTWGGYVVPRPRFLWLDKQALSARKMTAVSKVKVHITKFLGYAPGVSPIL